MGCVMVNLGEGEAPSVHALPSSVIECSVKVDIFCRVLYSVTPA